MIVWYYEHHDRGPVIEFGFRGSTPEHALSGHDAAKLLAGLEVALEDALRVAGRGKCLHCGIEQDVDGLHCWNCSGILEPLARGNGR